MSPGEVWLERAEALLTDRALPEASAAFEQAAAVGADPERLSGGRWMAAMFTGDFASAWRESDAIRERGGTDPHRFWQGEDLRDQRVIVRCLHGLGDAVQMLRYAPMLRRLAKSVVYEVPPRLLPLMPFFAGVEEAITWGEGAPARSAAWEVQIEIMELPYLARTLINGLPIAMRYVQPPAERILDADEQMGPRRAVRIGVVWAGGDWNPHRSLPVTLLLPFLNMAGVEFWNLQGTGAAEEARGLSLHNASICGDGLVSLAAVIANLDLVLTVDTLAAHLAGAMGKPVWVMLQHAADWRWMTDRDDSPWYPTMRLFRQPSPGDWTGVVSKVKLNLQEFAAGRLNR